MTCVEVAADAVQPEFLGVLLVVEMGGDPVVINSFGEQVDVAFFAGGVIDYLPCVLELPLGGPVDLVGVLGHLGPHVLGSDPGLGHVVLGEAFALRGKVAGDTVSHDSALAVVMLRLLPVSIRLLMDMAAHAILVRGRTIHGPADRIHRKNADQKPQKTDYPILAAAFTHYTFS